MRGFLDFISGTGTVRININIIFVASVASRFLSQAGAAAVVCGGAWPGIIATQNLVGGTVKWGASPVPRVYIHVHPGH